jgi:acyl transferase domain-containing protein
VAVNSFGFGGTNAHALLGPARVADVPTTENSDDAGEFDIFPFSARSAEALAGYADSYAEFIAMRSAPPFSMHELCAEAALGKAQHPIRYAVVADSLASLRTELASFRGALKNQATPAGKLKIAFVFSGQNSQWWAMGRQLFRARRSCVNCGSNAT